MQKIRDRLANDDPAVEYVEMDETRSITVRPGDKEKVIFTDSLGGCTAVAAILEQQNGTRTVILSHDQSMSTKRQFQAIDTLAASLLNPGKPTSLSGKSNALIMTLEDFDMDMKTYRPMLRKGPRVSSDPFGEAFLAESFKTRFGIEEVKRLVYPYETDSLDDNDMLVIFVPPVGKPVSYYTWFANGTLEAAPEMASPRPAADLGKPALDMASNDNQRVPLKNVSGEQ